MIDEQAIVVHTEQRIPYPEVTGYFVPTMYRWGEQELARKCTQWLLSIQNSDGSFNAPDGMPYTFDTAQVLRALCAASGDVDDVKTGIRKAGDWLMTQIEASGRIATPTTKLWGTVARELIHLYVLPPLIQAGEILGKGDYVEAAELSLEYYKKKHDIVAFNQLSHFHAYVLEALYELGEIDLVAQGMASVAKLQRRNGSVPAYPDVKWTCSTGLAQYAVVWYQIGDCSRGNRAFCFLDRLQNSSGGFYGSYGKAATYMPRVEISWAVKFYLDACDLKRTKCDKLS